MTAYFSACDANGQVLGAVSSEMMLIGPGKLVPIRPLVCSASAEGQIVNVVAYLPDLMQSVLLSMPSPIPSEGPLQLQSMKTDKYVRVGDTINLVYEQGLSVINFSEC